MATSPNYGWLEPDNTDLVKNGALAIRTLGNAIDTTMATMVPKSIVDAKGDLIAGTAADTAARLAVGNNGETLVADNSQTTGLAWAGNYAAGKNKFINGDFGIWQRGTSQSSGGYLADRFNANFSGATTVSQSRQTFTPGTAPVAGYEGKFFGRYVVTTVGASTEFYLNTYVEDVQNFAGQTATISFWIKADSTRTFSISVNQIFGSGGSTTVNTQIGTSFSVTTSWQRITRTMTFPSISGKTIGTGSHLQFFLFTVPTSGLTVDTWGWQVEQGSVATAFQTATGTLQGELAACQRYYWRLSPTAAYASYGQGWASTTTNHVIRVPFPVPMRALTTSVDYANLGITDHIAATISVTSLAIDANFTSPLCAILNCATGATFSSRTATSLINNNNTAGYLGFSAEL